MEFATMLSPPATPPLNTASATSEYKKVSYTWIVIIANITME